MYLIHCERSRLCWVRTLSSSSVGRLSCFVIHLSHCCRCCCRPQDICPVEASSLLSSSRGLVIHPPRCHRHPQAICPAEVTLLLLSSGPRRLSPTSSSSSTGHLPSKGLVTVVVWWVVTSSVPHRCHCHRRPPPTSSLSSAGHLPCTGLIAVIVWWGLRHLSPTIVIVVVISHPPHHCRHCGPWAICPAEASSSSSSSGGGLVVHSPRCCCCRGSSSTPHVVVVVVRGSFVLRRPRPRCCLVGASSSLPHIIDIVIVIRRPFVLRRPHRHRCPFGATSSVPHHCRRHHCLVEASSSLPHVIVVIVVRRSFVLRRPRHRRHSVGLPPCRSSLTILASSSSMSSSLLSGKGLVHC